MNTKYACLLMPLKDCLVCSCSIIFIVLRKWLTTWDQLQNFSWRLVLWWDATITKWVAQLCGLHVCSRYYTSRIQEEEVSLINAIKSHVWAALFTFNILIVFSKNYCKKQFMETHSSVKVFLYGLLAAEWPRFSGVRILTPKLWF